MPDYKNPAVRIQYVNTLLMMKFALRGLYADPHVCIKIEVYFGLKALGILSFYAYTSVCAESNAQPWKVYFN